MLYTAHVHMTHQSPCNIRHIIVLILYTIYSCTLCTSYFMLYAFFLGSICQTQHILCCISHMLHYLLHITCYTFDVRCYSAYVFVIYAMSFDVVCCMVYIAYHTFSMNHYFPELFVCQGLRFCEGAGGQGRSRPV